MHPRLTRHLAAAIPVCVVIFALTMAFGRSDVAGQARAGGAPAPPQTGRALAPVDLTGTWVSIVTEDWRWRMVTPPRGDVASIPVNAEGRKAAASWNIEADTQPAISARRTAWAASCDSRVACASRGRTIRR